ncbi:MAG: MBL fold metallo-hydrolase [Eubacterium sp.]|nr:MBL fold metallo-hydrolase [Eubacterium sp.]
MKLIMLGTGNAMVTKCFNTCFVMEDHNRYFLVDTGGGNRILSALEDVNVPVDDIHDIFLTHEHVDHLLGIIWLIRYAASKMNKGKYNGDLRIYCHQDLVNTILTICGLTLQKKMTKFFGKRIFLIGVEDGETREIIGQEVTFFDIHSTKARQYGFVMKAKGGQKIACAGDEPYNESEYAYVKNSDWLMHEAFCLASEADHFKPYEKHHSTVKDACELAEKLRIPNLILYHTEDTHIKNRKELYMEEGRRFYTGNLFVPDDLESIELD